MTGQRLAVGPPDAHARAAARVGEPPRPVGPATITPRRRPGYLGSVHVAQLLAVEAVVIAIAVALGQGLAVLATVAVLGVALLIMALSRRQGHWWLERQVMASQFRRRRQGRPRARGLDARLAALHWLAPGLTVEDITGRDGTGVGVAHDDAGWYAVVALGASAEMRDDAGPGLPLDELVNAIADAGQPGAVLQVVTHSVPAPNLDIDPNQPAGQSYRELLAQSGQVPIPVDRITWVVVRLDARALADDGDDAARGTDVANLVRRITRWLRAAGIHHEVLDGGELLDALVRSCDLAALAQTGRGEPREDWTAWHSGPLAHRTYWVRDWPPPAQVGALLDWLATAPAALSSVALILTPTDGQVDLRCLVRIAAPAKDLRAVGTGLARGARRVRAELLPLDGEQAPAVYASAPTGGGPR